MPFALILGLASGAIAGHLLLGVARAQSSCPVEWWDGNNKQNTRYDDRDGVWEDNHWHGYGAADTLYSQACNDNYLYGDGENDQVHAGSDSDHIYPGAGHDTLYGGAGYDDTVEGGDGPDDIYDRESDDIDRLYGNIGNDYLYAYDQDTKDYLYGGPDTDTCAADQGEYYVTGCE